MKKKSYIPKLNVSDELFEKELAFALHSDGSTTDYANSRKRAYNGQPWTTNGIRRKTEVKGLTMRDLGDCFALQ